MQVSPRYGDVPVLRIEGPIGDPTLALLRQRRRLGSELASLDEAQWAAPSRCDGWTVQDVVSHLVTVNGFWAVSLGAGMAGKPTEYLAGFDPVATPAQLVEGDRGKPPGAVLEAYQESVETLAETVVDRDEAAWAMPAEAPSGHIAAHAVVLHALWDAWIHERDILLPLGRTQQLHDDEVLGSLRYVAALGPAFRASTGDERTGTIAITTTEPACRLVVDLGSTVVVRDGEPETEECVRISAPAVDLVEALSFRAPIDGLVPADRAWMFDGLAEVFDLT